MAPRYQVSCDGDRYMISQKGSNIDSSNAQISKGVNILNTLHWSALWLGLPCSLCRIKGEHPGPVSTASMSFLQTTYRSIKRILSLICPPICTKPTQEQNIWESFLIPIFLC